MLGIRNSAVGILPRDGKTPANLHSGKIALLALIGLAAELSLAQSANIGAPAAIKASSSAAAQPMAASLATTAPSREAMEGLASVYSDKLNGRKTASGQIFRQNELTAAHSTLPFGTKVTVTNTRNNKSVEVRINDRGPTQVGRVIDMSSAAAAKIGIGKTGTAPVRLEVIGGRYLGTPEKAEG